VGSKRKATDNSARIGELKRQIENLADAIACGALRASPTIAARLAGAEAELEQLEHASVTTRTPVPDVTRLLTDLPNRAIRAVDELERTLAAGDLVRAREELKRQVGTISVQADEQEIRLFGQYGIETSLLRAVGEVSHASIGGSGGRI
jgi:hypothetical protein